MNINDIKIDKFICGDEYTPAQTSLAKMLEGENLGVSYADMMRYRVANKAAGECLDTYYVAHDGGKAYGHPQAALFQQLPGHIQEAQA